MIPRNTLPDKTPDTAEEITLLRREVHELRRELLNAVRYLTTHMHPHSDTAQRPETRFCHSCGGPLSHHPAESGELLLCPACGWSEFVSRNGRECCEVRPDPVPPTPGNPPWAA